MISLTATQLEAIKRHGEASFPEECGGLLLGIVKDGNRVIHEVVPLENVRADSRHNRIELSPRDYLKAEREAGRRGLGVWGYYHSHPNHPAVPSEFDRAHAPFVEWSYLILSVEEGRAAGLRAWTLREDRSQFDEEEMTLLEPDGRAVERRNVDA